MIARALLLAAAFAAVAPSASAQTAGGIQVAPVLVQMSPERTFGSLRLRNGRDRAVAFEVDVYAWTQVNGEDVLTPTDALLVAPGVFEVRPGSEQVLRLATTTSSRDREIAYRLILRELPSQQESGARLGFTLEMSLPVFVTPNGAEALISTQANNDTGLVLNNTGAAHARLISAESVQAGAIDTPRYLLAGARAASPLPQGTRSVRLRLYDDGDAVERIVQVDEADSRSSMR